MKKKNEGVRNVSEVRDVSEVRNVSEVRVTGGLFYGDNKCP